LVTQSKVGVGIGGARESKDVQTVVDRDDNDILVICEVLTVGEGCVGVATSET
jgi:hypothetical protein